jgi:hypothetical protein
MANKQFNLNNDPGVFPYESTRQLNAEFEQLDEDSTAQKEIDKIKRIVEKPSAHHANKKHGHSYITKKLKNDAYKSTIELTQSKLNKRDLVFSKFIHSRLIENISSALENTVANPLALLIGGAVSLVCGSILLAQSRYYGYELQLSVFGLLFLVGFIFGLVIDIIWQKTKRK